MNSAPRLASQVAIVTGGGSGFGESICQLFATHGAKIVVADFNAESGQRVADALQTAGHEAIFCRVDVSRSDEMGAMVQAAVQRFVLVDVMVNNAGMSNHNLPILDVTE